MRRILKTGVVLAVPIAILLFAITTNASEFGVVDTDTAVWTLSADSDACNTNQTGRVCAEWRTPTQSYGLICCVSPSAIGTSDPGGCEQLIDGHLGILPDRGPID